MKKNILFDLDGTLTDPSEGITACIAYALEKMKIPCPPKQQLKKYIGPPLWQSFAELIGTDDKAEAQAAVGIYRERFSTIGLYENTPYDGIENALKRIKSSGYKLFVCTSKPKVFAERILVHFRLDGFFNRVYGSSLDGTHVEKDGLIAHLLTAEKLNPVNTVMIGDRVYDIAGARANGIKAYGVSYGFGENGEFEEAEAVFGSPSELADYFTVQNPSAPEHGWE